MKVLVCGSRDYLTTTNIGRRIDELPAGSVILHGAARGADSIAAIYAACLGYRVISFPADWKTNGRKAGVIRNLQMLDERPDLVIAFWDGSSRGTKHTIDEARKRGIPVEVITDASRPSGRGHRTRTEGAVNQT
jgi:hypothetical protein